MTQTPSSTQAPLHQRLPRLSGWLLISLVLLIAVWCVAPHQLPVTLYKLSLVSLAGVVGYWLDRSFFPYARPDTFIDRFNTECTMAEEEEPNIPEGMGAMAVFPDHGLLRIAGVCMIRRAIIVGCAMLAMGLGA